ncbi:MAG: FAD-binding oxidoreductase, partial [Acidimicrobiales bacterium]
MTTVSTIADLQETVRGEVITPDHEAYGEARVVYNAMHDRRPAAVVRCVDAADVMAVVRVAADQSLDLAIRGGGHSVPGFGTVDDGLVVDLSNMKNVQVDPVNKRARVGGGATFGDLDHATHAFDLAAPGGIISTTGVTGLTLGGGIGYLSRGFGLSIDSLLSADVVTADAMRQAVASSVPAAAVDLNMKAFDKGYEYGVAQRA